MSDMGLMQRVDLFWVKGHLEGYADVLSVTKAKLDIETLVKCLRADAVILTASLSTQPDTNTPRQP